MGIIQCLKVHAFTLSYFRKDYNHICQNQIWVALSRRGNQVEVACLPWNPADNRRGHDHEHHSPGGLNDGDGCSPPPGHEVPESSDQDCEVQRVSKAKRASEAAEPGNIEVRWDHKQPREPHHKARKVSVFGWPYCVGSSRTDYYLLIIVAY